MKVYLDNAATTPLAPEVYEAIAPILKSNFGNPSSSHYFGRNAKALIENSRRSIARHLNCNTSEIIFTSGGTEADNMALLCAVKELGVKRIITSKLEHHAVGHTAENICTQFNVELQYVKHCGKGNVDLAHLEALLKDSFFTKGFYKEELFSTKMKNFVIQNARFGTNFLNKMSEFDVGQSVVVSDTIVYAIEALEGTDAMIIRAGELYNNYFQNNEFGPVLVKIPKLHQNFNMDLPVIGLETIKKCNELGFSSIVLSSKGTLITEIDIVKNYLKKNKFCIFAI